ncbi:hypothetical protein AB0G74_27770 [Streptomyces sp. NPDC020875]
MPADNEGKGESAHATSRWRDGDTVAEILTARGITTEAGHHRLGSSTK